MIPFLRFYNRALCAYYLTKPCIPQRSHQG